MSEIPSAPLLELARSYGVQAQYRGMTGEIEPAPAQSLLAVLRALGADVKTEDDVPLAIEVRRMATWRERVEPVVVAWDGALTKVEVRVPSSLVGSTVTCRLTLENGKAREWSAAIIEAGDADPPAGYSGGTVDLRGDFATGYHRLNFRFEDGNEAGTMIVSAPTRAYRVPDSEGKRTWGVFAPLYALHRDSSWGAGDFSDLEALIDWTAGLGGGLVATLPMLASNFDGPDPIISPYSPTSRIFWNEFYLDLSRIPELGRSEAAMALMDSEGFASEVAALRDSGLVNYGRQMRLRRALLEILAEEFDPSVGGRGEAFRAFLAENPDVEAYAAFQAAGERLGRDWRTWPEYTANFGTPNDEDAPARRYHLFAQWQADEQLRALAARARDQGLVWYLDFPIGVDFDSYDVRAHRESFATGASVGCPPDPVFTRGQNWGFPPLHPDRHRASGYAYLIASLRAHLKYANALRIDHVMGLHRLFWIPQGAEAKDGAFVSTPAEEIYAILSVESHRHSAWLVGEDLGTVPPEVDGAMKRHDVRGMYVIQYEARPDPEDPLRPVPEAIVASVNTHDMPPFAAFWGGIDLDDRKDLGLLTGEGLERERAVRVEQRSALVGFLESSGDLDPSSAPDDAGAVLRGIWRWLAASPSSTLLLNLEDLWLEVESQNTPNTYTERPNWRRKLRRSFDQFADDPAIHSLLKEVDGLRSRPAV